MAERREYAIRVGMVLLALLFLVTSVGLSIFVIWQNKQQSDQDKALTSQNADTNDTTNNDTTEEGMLKGTKLADFTPITDPVTELQKIDLVEGTGEEVKAGATVTAHYTGAYAVNGEIFESSHDSGQPIPFGLDQVIAGWTQGVPGMKVGGKRRLIIPGNLAYGEAPEGYTPGSTSRPMGPLVFDIELTAVENK